jgi:hypothetical protein
MQPLSEALGGRRQNRLARDSLYFTGESTLSRARQFLGRLERQSGMSHYAALRQQIATV